MAASSRLLGRILLSAAGGLALSCGLAYTAWSQPAPSMVSYSESEIRSVETPDEVRIRDLRRDEITQLRIALGRHAPSNRRADLYLRLAEIYIEAYRSDYLLEGRVHDKRLERGQPSRTSIIRARGPISWRGSPRARRS